MVVEEFSKVAITKYYNLFEGRKFYYHARNGYNVGRFEDELKKNLQSEFPVFSAKQIGRMLNPTWRFLRESYQNPKGIFSFKNGYVTKVVHKECNANDHNKISIDNQQDNNLSNQQESNVDNCDNEETLDNLLKRFYVSKENDIIKSIAST